LLDTALCASVGAAAVAAAQQWRCMMLPVANDPMVEPYQIILLFIGKRKKMTKNRQKCS
jgi:hypothetical protein